MESPSLHEGRILKRYKRFLADVELPNGEIVVAHVPNTGSMKTCWSEGWKVWLSHSANPARKLPWTLELTSPGTSLIMVNTANTNKLAAEALTNNWISELAGYPEVIPEQKILESRFDFLLTGHAAKPDCWVEVKNVTLLEAGTHATFPDAVSERGRKHLLNLIQLKQQGLRAAMLYVVSRTDAQSFGPAYDIDPAYARAFHQAIDAGVEILCYQVKFSEGQWRVSHALPVVTAT